MMIFRMVAVVLQSGVNQLLGKERVNELVLNDIHPLYIFAPL